MKGSGHKNRNTIILLALAAVCLVGSILLNQPGGEAETIKATMKEAVLHESSKISLFGIKDVNPAYLSSCVVVIVLLLFALCIRIFVIPRFRYVPGKFQMLLELWVSYFENLAKSNSPHRNRFLGLYVFSAGSYICVGTMFELFGFQAVNTLGASVALPAPLSDINAAIALGCLSYFVILSGGIVGNGLRGVGNTLKDFSLAISMSFRLFGALLSGLLVTELVYYYLQLSFILPVIVGVLFTLLHALIQTYVLTTLTALFYGEVSEPHAKKKKSKNKKIKKQAEEQAAA